MNFIKGITRRKAIKDKVPLVIEGLVSHCKVSVSAKLQNWLSDLCLHAVPLGKVCGKVTYWQPGLSIGENNIALRGRQHNGAKNTPKQK